MGADGIIQAEKLSRPLLLFDEFYSKYAEDEKLIRDNSIK